MRKLRNIGLLSILSIFSFFGCNKTGLTIERQKINDYGKEVECCSFTKDKTTNKCYAAIVYIENKTNIDFTINKNQFSKTKNYNSCDGILSGVFFINERGYYSTILDSYTIKANKSEYTYLAFGDADFTNETINYKVDENKNISLDIGTRYNI